MAEDPGELNGEGDATERRLVLSYVPDRSRAGVATLMALDARLGSILRTTREPLIGQMRLTWWHEALTGLDEGKVLAEPLLGALARDVIPVVSGARLATMVEGWEALLDPPLDEAALTAHATARGVTLFGALATVIGGRDAMIQAAGRGWALADVALHLSDHQAAERARSMALHEFRSAFATRWKSRTRALGALALSAKLNIAEPRRPAGHPSRAARLLWHRISGR